MPIGYRDGITGYQNGGTSVAATTPATIQAGDVLFAFLGLSEVTIGDPSISGGVGSWVLIAGGPIDDNTCRTKLWYKICAAGDASASMTASWTSSGKAGLILEAYSGAHQVLPVGTTQGTDFDYQLEPGTDTTHDAPGVTPNVPDAWIVEFCAQRSSAALTSFTAPGARTARHTQLGSGAGTIGQVSADSNGIVAPNTASGAQTYTSDVSSANAVAFSVALRAPDPVRRILMNTSAAGVRAGRW